VNNQFFFGEELERAVPFGVNGVSEIAFHCREHRDDRTQWSSAALSTFSPIANFDIENSYWNNRRDNVTVDRRCT
jgi:hypothetical protein